MTPSIKDVAQMAGCSTSTVSRVLNNRDAVDPETRQRVLKAIESLDYKPNLVATGLRVKKGNLIALVVPETVSHSFSYIIHFTMESARRCGYHVIFGDTRDDPDVEEAFIDDLLRRHINGIIFSRVSDESRIMPKLIKRRIPFVVVDRTLEQEGVPSVVLDNAAAGRLAAEHLTGLGHRKVACITGPLKIGLCRDRLHGFRSALEARSVPFTSADVYEGDFKFQSGVDAVRSLLRRDRGYSAVWTQNDMMAFGVLRELRSENRRVPEEVSVVGMDDMDFCDFVVPALTSVHQPFDQMAAKAVELIVRLNDEEAVGQETVILNPSFTLRSSTAESGGTRG